MTWVAYKKSVENILKPEGYLELPDNQEVENAPQNRSNKVYTLRPGQSEDVSMSSNVLYRFKFADFRFLYSVKDNNDFAEKYDEFLRVIALLPNASTINSTPTFEMDDTNEFAIGELSLLATSSSC